MTNIRKERAFLSIELPANMELIIHPTRLIVDMDQFIFPHRLKQGCFLMVSKGECIIDINLIEHHITAKCVVVILPESIVSISNVSNDFDCSLTTFPAKLFKDNELMRTLFSSAAIMAKLPVLHLSDEKSDLLERTLNSFSDIRRNLLKNGGLVKLHLRVFRCLFLYASIYFLAPTHSV